MNPKYLVLYLLLIPGIIFSLLSLFVGFSWIVLIISFLVGVILLVRSEGISVGIPTQTPSGISSKIKAINFDSAISTILIAVAIVLVVGIVVLAITLVRTSSPEDFSDDNTFKDYYYQGEYMIEDEVLKICGSGSVINEDASHKFLGVWYFPAKNQEFGFMTGGEGAINITMKNGYDNFSFQTINVSAPVRVKFGTSLVPGKRSKLWLKAGKEDLSPPDDYFNTGGKYSVEIEANGFVWIDELYIGG